VNKGGGLITHERLWLAVAGGRSGQSIGWRHSGFPTNRARNISFRATVPQYVLLWPTGRFRWPVEYLGQARWSTILIDGTGQVGVFMGPHHLRPIARSWATWQTNTWLAFTKQVGAGRSSPGPTSGSPTTSSWKGDSIYQAQAQCANYPRTKIYNIPSFWYNVFRWVAGDGSSCFQWRIPPSFSASLNLAERGCVAVLGTGATAQVSGRFPPRSQCPDANSSQLPTCQTSATRSVVRMARRAAELEKGGHEIVKLNIAIPAPSGFCARNHALGDESRTPARRRTYLPQKGIFLGREAVVMQQQSRGYAWTPTRTMSYGQR